MNKRQVKDSASEQKGRAKGVADKVTDGESAEQKGKFEKHGGKDGSVLGEINDGPKKEKNERFNDSIKE